MDPPRAFLLTWTTYGTWLHGDSMGSADRSGEHRYGRTYIEENHGRNRFEISELRSSPVVLGEHQRTVVNKAIGDHTEFRKWGLHAINVRTNHVHVVVSCPCPPEKPLREFKAWATRRLREAKLVGSGARVWTRHGSTRYLFNDDAVQRAIRYVRDGQGPPQKL